MELERLLEFAILKHEYESLEPSNMSLPVVYHMAEVAFNNLGIGIRDDIEPAIKKLDGKIHYLTLEEIYALDMEVLIHDKNSFDTFIPRCTGIVRDRLQCARAIGHFHIHNREKGFFTRTIVEENEKTVDIEANHFALGFLMPTSIFKKTVEEIGAKNVHKLSMYFNVYDEWMKIRLRHLETYQC